MRLPALVGADGDCHPQRHHGNAPGQPRSVALTSGHRSLAGS
jgi:hypothetical protein